MQVLNYLVPRFPLRDLPVLFAFMVLGTIIAGTYGILHDQITYTIGPSYFTKFKFEQFEWANIGLPIRAFVACIGFLATWWVGMICGWILARRMLPNQSRKMAARKILMGFGVIFFTGIVFGLLGFGYGIYRGPEADYSAWSGNFRMHGITQDEQWSFMQVAYIHNAGYLGGLVGLILTFFVLRPVEDSDSKIEAME